MEYIIVRCIHDCVRRLLNNIEKI